MGTPPTRESPGAVDPHARDRSEVVTGAPWAEPAPLHVPASGRRALILGWVMFAVAIPLNAIASMLAVFVAVIGAASVETDGERLQALAFLAIPVLLIVGTLVQLVRLARRKPSLVLGVLVLIPGVLAMLWRAAMSA